MDKRIFLLMFAMLLILPSVSALELNPFADVKNVEKTITPDMSDFIKADFNSQYGVIRLSKTFFWFETDKVAEYSLTKNTEQCLIDCEAEGKASLYFDGQLFEDTIFKTRQGDQININAKYYLKGSEDFVVETPVYKEVCQDVFDAKNGTTSKSCTNELVETLKETKTKDVWNAYNGEILKAGNYEWKLQGKKHPAQSVDFIPIKSEKEFSEWAWWNAGATKFPITINTNGLILDTNSTVFVSMNLSNITKFGSNINKYNRTFLIYQDTTEIARDIVPNGVANETIKFKIQANLNATANTDYSIYVLTATDGTPKTRLADVYWVGDDFSEVALNTTIWQTGGSGNVGVSGGIATVTSTGAWMTLNTYNKFNPNVTLEMNISGHDWLRWGVGIGDGTTLADMSTGMFNSYSFAEVGGGSLRLGYNWGTSTAYTGERWEGYYKTVKVEFNNTAQVFQDQEGDRTSTAYSFDGSLKSFFVQSNTDDGTTTMIDYIKIYKTGLSYSATTGAEQTGNQLAVTLNSPATAYNTSNPSITFNCSATDETGVLNLTLIINNADNYTITGGVGQNLSLQVSRTLAQGNGNWTCRASDGSGSGDPTTASIRTFTVDSVNPTIYGLNNITNISTLSMPINSTHLLNVTDAHLGSCGYWTSDNSTNTTITCNSSFNILWNTGGSKIIYAWANDTFGNINSTTGSFNIYDFNVTQSGETTAGEGSEQTFTFLVNSTSFAIGDASANIWYDGANKGYTTKTAMGSGSYYFTKTFTIPSGTGNSTGKDISWYWNYNATQLTTRNTSTQTQTVYNVSITDCALIGGRVILNMSLKDEELNTLVNITTPNTAVIEIDMDVTSLINSSQVWSFSKKWESNNTVSVCVPNGLLNDTSYRIDFTAGYEATGKVKEFYYMDNGTLDNTVNFNSYTDNTIDLMDLASADSTTFLFTFTDANGLEVDDALIHTFRNYIGEGLFREVERSKQDNNGETHVHIVEEDVIYYFMISQYGNIIYTSDTYNAKCLSTPCAISLSASPTETNWSIIDNEGGRYSITSDQSTRIATLDFSLDSSALVNFSLYSYEGSTATLINQTSLTAMSGSVDLLVPLAYGNKTFFAVVYNNNTFVKSQWIDLTDRGQDYFGTFGGILAGLIVLAMMLMAVTEGAGFIIFTVLALIVVTVMKLVDLNWMALISIICAGAIIMWKLVNRRNKVN